MHLDQRNGERRMRETKKMATSQTDIITQRKMGNNEKTTERQKIESENESAGSFTEVMLKIRGRDVCEED